MKKKEPIETIKNDGWEEVDLQMDFLEIEKKPENQKFYPQNYLSSKVLKEDKAIVKENNPMYLINFRFHLIFFTVFL